VVVAPSWSSTRSGRDGSDGGSPLGELHAADGWVLGGKGLIVGKGGEALGCRCTPAQREAVGDPTVSAPSHRPPSCRAAQRTTSVSPRAAGPAAGRFGAIAFDNLDHGRRHPLPQDAIMEPFSADRAMRAA
jgi:hypothetical protein